MTINKMFTIEPNFNIMKTQPTFPLVSGYHPADLPPRILADPKIARPSRLTIGRYVDILYDKWFKEILGAEGNKDVLMEILRELIPERKIVDISYGAKRRRKVNPFIGGHDAFFDVECKDADGTRFVVEMQKDEQVNFADRALFYSTFPIQEQVEAEDARRRGRRRGHDAQFAYPPVYVVSFLNFSRHGDTDQILFRYDLRERSSRELMTDRINFIFLEMKNFRRAESRPEDSFVEKISYAFTHMGSLTERPAALMEEVFRRLFEACEVKSMPSEKQNQYQRNMTTKRDRENILYTAELRGEKRGMEKGISDGQEKEKRRIAAEMKKLGLADPVICQATDLSLEEVRAL